MNRKLLLLITLFWSSFVNSQNILTNGDFEDYSNSWGTVRTVDFYGVPEGFLGTMTAQDGTRFCGLRFHASSSDNWQEYIWQDVEGSMTAGATYKVSIYHCLADMCTRTTDDFGVAFTTNPFAFYGTNSEGAWLNSVTPQVRLQDGDFRTNDISWTELSGYYQATGNETYTIVGSFKDDNSLDTIGIQSDHSYTQGDVYFFIDNFRITECIDYPQIDLEELTLCEDGEVSLDAFYPGATYLWSTGDTTSSITMNIDQTSSFSVILSKNGCTYQDTTKITLFTEGTEFDDIWFCDRDQLPIERSVTVNQNEQLLWENGSDTSTRVICESGVYSYTKSFDNCSYTDTFQVSVFEDDVLPYPNPGVDYINFTNSNDVSVTSIFSSDGRLIENEPIDGQNLDLVIQQLSPGMYLLTIDGNGCRNMLKYEKLLIK